VPGVRAGFVDSEASAGAVGAGVSSTGAATGSGTGSGCLATLFFVDMVDIT
jgi:hypothetical protein